MLPRTENTVRYIKRLATVLGVGFAAVLITLGISQPANAAAYTRGAYAPYVNLGGNIEAWANIANNCEGTFGCWAYVKIEAVTTAPLVVKPWTYLGGYWAHEGWNQVVVTGYSGCTSYRLIVDTYNDAPSNNSVGITAGGKYGGVEATLGGNIKRYHASTSSSIVRLCRYA